jgi:hypothetical protein
MLTTFSPLKLASDQNILKKGMSDLNKKKVAVGQNDIKKRQVQRSYFMFQILWSVYVGGVNTVRIVSFKLFHSTFIGCFYNSVI